MTRTATRSNHASTARPAQGTLSFIKMQGCGNDYVYVNGFEYDVDNPAEIARQVADRNFGIGSDGLILVLPPSDAHTADVRMRMFNADGSESEMCGNGIRCVCKLAHDEGIATRDPLRVETGAGVLELRYETDEYDRVIQVTVDMGEPALESARIPSTLPGPSIIDHPLAASWNDIDPGWFKRCGLDPRITCVSMGNPHVVLFCGDVGAVPLERIGPVMERWDAFPKRVNVHVVQVHSRSEVTMRTWERGSGITLACGTGASAVCVASALTNRADREILAHLPGGDLRLRWDEATNHVFKTGPAVEVYRGDWRMPAGGSPES